MKIFDCHNTSFRKQCSPIVFMPMSFMLNNILMILLNSSIGKVVNSIVVFIAIKMSNYQSIRTLSNKNFCYQCVDVQTFLWHLVKRFNRNTKIWCARVKFSNHSSIWAQSSKSTMIANFVKLFIIRHFCPNFRKV